MFHKFHALLESKLRNCQTDPTLVDASRPDILEAGHLPCSAAETLPAQNLSYSNNPGPFEVVIVWHHSDSILVYSSIPFKWKTIQKNSPQQKAEKNPEVALPGHLFSDLKATGTPTPAPPNHWNQCICKDLHDSTL